MDAQRIKSLAETEVSLAISALIDDALQEGLDVTDDHVWQPLKQAHLARLAEAIDRRRAQ